MSERNGPLPEIPETPAKPALPADLAAVQADDALLDVLRIDPALADADPELIRLLLTWRRDIDAESLPSLVGIGTALAIVRTRSRRTLAGRIADAVRWLIGGGR